MGSWFQRWQRRQSDLAQGVDADLVRDNSNKYKRGFFLLAFAFLLSFVSGKVRFPRPAQIMLESISVASFIAGVLTLMWAGLERTFLDKPEPQEPPRIFK